MATRTSASFESKPLVPSLGALANARSLAAVAPGRIGQHTVFRAACPTRDWGPGPALRPRTVVDLRSGWEKQHSDKPRGEHSLASVPGCTVVHEPGLCEGMDGIAMRALGSASLGTKCCCVLSMLICQPSRAATYVGPVMLAPHNCVMLYRHFLDANGAAFVRILTLCCDRANFPLLIHCSTGRDRTGMVAMLIEHVAGLPRTALVADYAASTQCLRAAFDRGWRHEMLPPSEPRRSSVVGSLCLCAPSTMESVLDYIDERWGGLDQYLDAVGFGAEKRAAMRAAIQADLDLDAPPATATATAAGQGT